MITTRSLGICLALAACGTEGGAPQSLEPDNGTHLVVTIQKTPRAIVVGSSATIVVAVARDGNDAYDGDVDVALAPAEGFSSVPVAIARAASTAALQVAVAPNRKHGDVPLRVVATSKDQKATGDVALTVVARGKPGDLDSSFGNGGIFALGEPAAEATGLAVQPDGKIVLGGRIGADAAVVRLNSDGTLDAAFANGGKARASVSGLVSTNDAVVLPDGAIVIGGTGAVRSFVARFTKTGAPDPKFGSQGIVIAAGQSRSTRLLFADGRLYLAGQSAAPADRDAMHLLGLRFDGAPDNTFGTTAEAVLPLAPGPCALGPGECFLSAIDSKPIGQLTLCASRGDGVNFRELFQGGIENRNVDLTTTAAIMSRCTAIINDGPDALWAAGARDANLFQVLHFKKSLTGGPLVVDLQRRPVAIPEGAALGGATRFIVGGNTQLVASADATPNGGPSQFALVRVNSNTLALDASFAGKGWLTTAIGATPAKTRALAVQIDGRLVVAGTNGDMVAARYWP